MTKVFINGGMGTTGLRLAQRLSQRGDVQLLAISEELRKDAAEVRELMDAADVTFLCLPDDASVEAVQLAQGLKTKIIDASTAHRTNAGWQYGFPELSPEHRSGVAEADRLAVPGCHATGVISLLYPLLTAGILDAGYPLSITSLTGYSGGGKAMIAEYEDENRAEEYDSPRHYSLAQSHKHIPEIMSVCKLEYVPVFAPVVADFYSGMLVTVPIQTRLLQRKPKLQDLVSVYLEHYKDSRFVKVVEPEASGFMSSNLLSGRDDLEISVIGNDERVLLAARFDNLGKGASGAAIQCFNIMTGADEAAGLQIS